MKNMDIEFLKEFEIKSKRQTAEATIEKFNKIAEMLRKGGMSFKQISAALGYKSESQGGGYGTALCKELISAAKAGYKSVEEYVADGRKCAWHNKKVEVVKLKGQKYTKGR